MAAFAFIGEMSVGHRSVQVGDESEVIIVVISASPSHPLALPSAFSCESAAGVVPRSFGSVCPYSSASSRSTLSCRSAFRSQLVLPQLCRGVPGDQCSQHSWHFRCFTNPEVSGWNSPRSILLKEPPAADHPFGFHAREGASNTKALARAKTNSLPRSQAPLGNVHAWKLRFFAMSNQSVGILRVEAELPAVRSQAELGNEGRR